MGYQRTMYLLSLLYAKSKNHQTELTTLFRQAIAKTDEYQQLSKLLQQTTYLGMDGEKLYNDSRQAIELVVKDIQNPVNNLQSMRLLVERTTRMLEKTEEWLRSPRFFDEDFIAIRSETISVCSNFYRTLANAICYMLLTFFGPHSIRNLTYNQSITPRELVKLINQQYANELVMSAAQKKPAVWQISREAYTGDNIACFNGFRIDYNDWPIDCMDQRVKTGEFRRLSPYLYVNNDLSQNTLYIGVGNIMGVDVSNSISMLNASIVTCLPADVFKKANLMLSNPIGEIIEALQTDAFCLPPGNFLDALNRHTLNSVVIERQRSHMCIFCGKPAQDGRISCEEHIRVKA